MKILSSTTIQLLALFTLTLSFYLPKNVFALSVPFQNEVVGRNSSINASYNFGQPPNKHGSIFCFANTAQPNIGTASWTFNGRNPSASLPTTLVPVNSNSQGQTADQKGTITITNTINAPLVVNCIFPN